MAASRPSIDLDEDIAALLERARVSALVSGKVVPQLLAQDVGNVAALLEAVAEDGLEGLGRQDRATSAVPLPAGPEQLRRG